LARGSRAFFAGQRGATAGWCLSGGALPDIGIRLSGAIEPLRCIELAQAAENAGFASVWFAENPFQRGVMATAGACAAATRRIRMGVGVVNPFSRHPALIAMEFAALDALSQGRVILGIGSGIAAAVRQMGFDADRPVTAVREAVTIIRRMLAGESATARGRVFQIDRARLDFLPPRLDLPIYMAAAGAHGLKACGEIADGLLVSNLTPRCSVERMSEMLATAAAPAGRATPKIVQYVPCVCRPDGDAARQIVKRTIGEMLKAFWPSHDNWPPAKEAIARESGIPRREFAAALDRLRRGENTAHALDERYVAAFAIAGTADECREQVARYHDAGADELALTFAGDEPLDDMAYFARSIL
jgi:5,10-methylenetetrahydromethanopterin reductase